MNRGRGGSRGGGGYRGYRGGRGGGGRNYAARGSPATPTHQWVPRGVVGAGAHVDNPSSGTESSEIGKKSSEKASLDGVTKKLDDLSSSEFPSEPNSESHGSLNVPPNDENFKGAQNVPETEPKPSNVTDIDPCYDNHIPSLPTSSGLNERRMSCSPSHFIPTSPETISCQFSPEVQSGKQTSEGTSGKNKLDSSDLQHNRFSFDICEERSSSGVKLKTSLHIKNKAIRNEKHRAEGDNIKIIRSGMILLKGHISLNDQVKMVKSCRDLGRGPGGFYQPGYSDGAKLHLKMMCLGKNWDPETSRYGDTRPIDQAKPPPIPEDFQQFVKDVVLKCHRHLELEHKIMNAGKILPPMSPNICIINFYTRTGKLGLHQDKDESPESRLKKRLPVVSVSLGDTAEFLFGDDGDVNKAEKVQLESGDVLIFGGESRHIFHGVSKIVEKTAPEVLLEETRLKPGRVNLTFREY